jgi:hypothetical protein
MVKGVKRWYNSGHGYLAWVDYTLLVNNIVCSAVPSDILEKKKSKLTQAHDRVEKNDTKCIGKSIIGSKTNKL